MLNEFIETSPLLTDSSSSTIYGPYIKEDETDSMDAKELWIHIAIGDLLQSSKPFRPCLKFVFHLILGNTFLAIGVILLSKVYGWTSYQYLFPHSLPLNDWWFQLANLSLVLSYTISNLLPLRICLFFACLFFALFGWFGLGDISADCVLYNFAMSIINLGYIAILLWEKRYIRFDPAWEDIYTKMFKTVGVSRHVFELLLKKGVVREKGSGTVLHNLGDNVTSLCILVHGKVNLYNRHGELANTYGDLSVLEGIEWCQTDFDPEGRQFEHRFVARTDVIFVKWSRETMVRLLRKHPELMQPLRMVLGLNAAKTTYRLLNSMSLKSTAASTEEAKLEEH